MTVQTSAQRRSRRTGVVRRSAAAAQPRAMRFVETKLRPPMLRDDVIVRELLLDHLRTDVTSFKLTLVSAPAGYGKTIMMASLPRALPDAAIAWLSLDEDDNDPNVFVAALVESLRRVDARIVEEATALLGSASGAPRAVLDALINDVVAHHPTPIVIVLDDFHRVTDAAIAKAVEYLIERMPPQMHVMIGTRHDPQLPLPRLRARPMPQLSESFRARQRARCGPRRLRLRFNGAAHPSRIYPNAEHLGTPFARREPRRILCALASRW